MLTRSFQRASGGLAAYPGFWNTIESAELLEIAADPEALTVSYTVAHVKADGTETTANVVMALAFRKNSGRYLIAEEN